MKDGHPVLVSDIDGTAFYWSLPPRIQEFLLRHKHWLILASPLFPAYIFRPCNRKTRALIRENQEKGGRNIFVSATKDMRLTRPIVNACLRASHMPLDELILCPQDESARDFKLRIVQEEGCDILLEDEKKIVDHVVDVMRREGVHSDVTKNGGGYFTVRFSKN